MADEKLSPDFGLVAPLNGTILESKDDWFRVGDLVTRDGTDIHEVFGTNGCDRYAPDMIEVRCVLEPIWKWTRLGEEENNLASRYERVTPRDEVEMRDPEKRQQMRAKRAAYFEEDIIEGDLA